MEYQILKKNFKVRKIRLVFSLLIISSNSLFAQQNDSLPTLEKASLQNCVQYAIQHNPDVQNAKINEQITEARFKISWLIGIHR